MTAEWSVNEVNLIVTDYMSMLIAELKGVSYNKTAHAENLKPRISNRTRGSIEFKHCNISAAMIEKGLPYIDGYKPRGNYQALVSDVIDEYLSIYTEVLDMFNSTAQSTYRLNEDVESRGQSSLLDLYEESPIMTDGDSKRKGTPSKSYDYADRENRNKTLGDMGEQLIFQYERERLATLGRADLADRICWVSKEIGDGEGYDIKSYNIDGTVRYIEVKTTNCGKCFPFYFTIN